MSKAIRLGFLGFGEAAGIISAGLVEEGLTGILAYDKFWDDARCHRASKAGVKPVTGNEQLVEGADLILSMVVPQAALEAARETVPHLDRTKIYADMNSVSPITKREIADTVAPSGAAFVDAALMESVPSEGHKVPIIACGDGAEVFRSALAPYGMDIRVIQAPPGAAAAVKMLRSVFMKGVEALLLEALSAARLCGVEDVVLDSVSGSLERRSFAETVDVLLRSDSLHAGRKAQEMGEVMATLEDLGIEPIMSEAAKRRLEWSAGLNLGDLFSESPPSDYKGVISAIVKRLKED